VISPRENLFSAAIAFCKATSRLVMARLTKPQGTKAAAPWLRTVRRLRLIRCPCESVAASREEKVSGIEACACGSWGGPAGAAFLVAIVIKHQFIPFRFRTQSKFSVNDPDLEISCHSKNVPFGNSACYYQRPRTRTVRAGTAPS
jgi:hypothetical protein